MKKLVILLLVIIVLTGCGNKNKTKEEIVVTELQKEKVDIILLSVELAYTKATFDNNGEFPTLEQVAKQFDYDGIKMTSKGEFVGDNLEGIKCETIVNNIMVVTCEIGSYKNTTTSDLTLSNN